MKEIVERLKENRDIELAKSILESNGYSFSRMDESSATVNIRDLLPKKFHLIKRISNNQFLYPGKLEDLINDCKSAGWDVEKEDNYLNVFKGSIYLQVDRYEDKWLFTNPSGTFSGWYTEGKSAKDCTITIEGVVSGTVLDEEGYDWEKNLKDIIISAIKDTDILTGSINIKIDY